MPHVEIRDERPDDAAKVAGVVMRAYEDIAYSNHREHVMVERLRADEAYVPKLSLVADVDGAVVGHLMLTRATIRSGEAASATLALAPLSVAPEHQRMGIGSRLVTTAHARAAAMGFGSIVVVGIPGFYPRFGYLPLSQYPITLPFPLSAEASLILPLRPGALEGVSGEVRYAVVWLNH